MDEVSEGNVIFPMEVQERMRAMVIHNLDIRVTDLTTLVSLQEGEMAFLWIVILGLVCYVARKDYNARQRNS